MVRCGPSHKRNWSSNTATKLFICKFDSSLVTDCTRSPIFFYYSRSWMIADFARPPDRQINRFAMSKRDDFINKPDFILSSVWVQGGREWSQSKFFFFNRLFSCHSFCGKSIERTWNSFERRRNSSSFYKVTVFVAFGIFLCFVRIGMNFLSWLRNFTKSMSLSSTQAVEHYSWSR